jgi:hypothetical protein
MPNAADARPAGPRHRRPNVGLALFLVAIVLSPPALIATAFWAASAPWEFSGVGVRYWIFVKGSTIDRLGFVSATDAPARYVVRIGEGTDPGAVTASYDSKALPAEVIAAYAKRCRAMGLAIKKQTVATDAVKATLVCEGRQDVYAADDVWVIAERAQDNATTVLVTAGPGLTATYDF